MKLIVLAGLVSVEKVDLAVELAAHYRAQGRSVTVIDNIGRLRIDPVLLGDETLIWHRGDITRTLPDLLDSVQTDVVILAVSESAPPDALFTALLDVTSAYAVEVQSIAMIDLRTCDCFPHIRALLESYADIAVNMPYRLDEVLAALPHEADV